MSIAYYSCTKRFSEYPFSHRQHTHQGHCALVHGHSFSFDVEFICAALDENGFVMDFGQLQPLKESMNECFDHTLVLGDQDPALKTFKELQKQGLCKLTILPGASAEALAKFVFHMAGEVLSRITLNRVRVRSVVCWEDSKNNARYQETVF